MDYPSRPASVFSTTSSVRSRTSIRWTGFGGTSTESVMIFIQEIQRTAVEQLRHEDDGWVAQYAAGCMNGHAMIWHAELDPATQASWSKLRLALLRQYDLDGPDRYSVATYRPQVNQAPTDSGPIPAPLGIFTQPAAFSAHIPAPIRPDAGDIDNCSVGTYRPRPDQAPKVRSPPAYPTVQMPFTPTSTRQLPTPPSSQSSNDSTASFSDLAEAVPPRQGRIYLVDSVSGKFLGYVARHPRDALCYSLADALIVEIPTGGGSKGTFQLRMVNSDPEDMEFPFLGLHLQRVADPACWTLRHCSASFPEMIHYRRARVLDHPDDLGSSAVWGIYRRNDVEELGMTWLEASGNYMDLKGCFWRHSGMIVPSVRKPKDIPQKVDERHARFIFQPV